MHSFSYVRGFSCEGFFYTVTSFNKASEDSVSYPIPFTFLILSRVPLHLPYEGRCQNNGRPEMTDRRCQHPDMTDSPSTGSGGSLPSFVLTALLYVGRCAGGVSPLAVGVVGCRSVGLVVPPFVLFSRSFLA